MTTLLSTSILQSQASKMHYLGFAMRDKPTAVRQRRHGWIYIEMEVGASTFESKI